MNCREFLAEFEERTALTQAALTHLNDCPGCRKTSGEQTRIWQMVDAMTRVDAPTNFEFRVKARIAQGRPAEVQPKFLPALRYVLPLGLVVLILGLVVLNAVYFSNNNSAPIVAETILQTPDAAPIQSSNSSLPEVAAITNLSQSFTNENVIVSSSNQSLKPTLTEPKEALFVKAGATKKLPGRTRKENPKDAFEGGSRVIASTTTGVLTPEGFPSNKPPQTAPNTNILKPISDEEILSLIGIETTSENGRKKVKSLKSASLAERSGVQVGDIIEAIDGKAVGSEPARTGTFESKKLTVLRGTEKIEIVLQNK